MIKPKILLIASAIIILLALKEAYAYSCGIPPIPPPRCSYQCQCTTDIYGNPTCQWVLICY